MSKTSPQLSPVSPDVDVSAAPTPETLRDQLHLVESGVTQIKKALHDQGEYLGLMMREIMEVRADAKAGKALGEFVTLKLAPLINDPTLLVDLEELRRGFDTNREEMIAAMPPRRQHPSFSELTDTGKHDAITESQLKLTMALDRVRELEEKLEERDKANAVEKALLQKKIDDEDAKRKFWSKTIVGIAATIVAGICTWQAIATLSSHEKTTTTEVKEKQR